MVWPSEVAQLWLALVASVRAVASVWRLQACLWVVPLVCGWLWYEVQAELEPFAPALSRTPLSLLNMSLLSYLDL